MTSLLLAGTIGTQLDTIFAGFDYSVFEFFGSMQSSFMTLIAKCLTALGSEVFIILFAVMGLVMIFFKRTRKLGIAVVIAVIVGTLITNVAIKPLVLRIRPYNTLQTDPQYWAWYTGAGMLSESDYCFPSGHTTGNMEIAIVLMLCHITSKRKAAKGFCWLFPVGALLVGASRIYLMVHYATDVIGGVIVGIVAGIIGYVAASLITRKHANDPETVAVLERNVRTGGAVAIALAVIVMFIFAAYYVRANGGQEAVRCAFDGDYKCQNEAKTSSKYPPIDGKYYCKIHWNELNGK